RVVVTPFLPPLKRTSGPLALKGACSGNSTSTLVLPLPRIDFGQAPSADLVSRACSAPSVQAGMPLTSIEPFLSVSATNSFSAGGGLASVGAIFASTLKVVRVGFVFEE